MFQEIRVILTLNLFPLHLQYTVYCNTAKGSNLEEILNILAFLQFLMLLLIRFYSFLILNVGFKGYSS